MIHVSELQVENIEIIITSKSHRYIFTDSRFTVGLFAIELVVPHSSFKQTKIFFQKSYKFKCQKSYLLILFVRLHTLHEIMAMAYNGNEPRGTAGVTGALAVVSPSRATCWEPWKEVQ